MYQGLKFCIWLKVFAKSPSKQTHLSSTYKNAGSVPVKVDTDVIEKMGIEVVQKNLVDDRRFEDGHDSFVRHSPNRLARVIYYWFRKTEKKDRN